MSSVSITAQEIRSSPAIAFLETVSYAGLTRSEPETLRALQRAVLDQGFFYLTLDDPISEKLAQDAEDLIAVSRGLFRLPTAEKMEFDTKILAKERNYGYKPRGRNAGINGAPRDGHELYLIPRDILFESQPNLPAFTCPDPLYKEKGLLKSFSNRSEQICTSILAALSQYLPHDGINKALEAAHHSHKASTTAIGLIRYPAHGPGNTDAGHIAHTDVGSLTLLFATQFGLQVEDPKRGSGSDDTSPSSWLHVVPRPHTAVVNVGDALRLLSNLTFRSCLHRVLPNVELTDRYSIAYFLRPSVETSFRDVGGRVWTSLEWHNRKFETFQSAETEKKQNILQGLGEEL